MPDPLPVLILAGHPDHSATLLGEVEALSGHPGRLSTATLRRAIDSDDRPLGEDVAPQHPLGGPVHEVVQGDDL